jgi:hypothetical protein
MDTLKLITQSSNINERKTIALKQVNRLFI